MHENVIVKPIILYNIMLTMKRNLKKKKTKTLRLGQWLSGKSTPEFRSLAPM